MLDESDFRFNGLGTISGSSDEEDANIEVEYDTESSSHALFFEYADDDCHQEY